MFCQKALPSFSFNNDSKQLFLQFVRNTKKQDHTKMQFYEICFNNFSPVYNAFLINTSSSSSEKVAINNEHLLTTLKCILYIPMPEIFFSQLFRPSLQEKTYFSSFSSHFFKVTYFSSFFSFSSLAGFPELAPDDSLVNDNWIAEVNTSVDE